MTDEEKANDSNDSDVVELVDGAVVGGGGGGGGGADSDAESAYSYSSDPGRASMTVRRHRRGRTGLFVTREDGTTDAISPGDVPAVDRSEQSRLDEFAERVFNANPTVTREQAEDIARQMIAAHANDRKQAHKAGVEDEPDEWPVADTFGFGYSDPEAWESNSGGDGGGGGGGAAAAVYDDEEEEGDGGGGSSSERGILGAAARAAQRAAVMRENGARREGLAPVPGVEETVSETKSEAEAAAAASAAAQAVFGQDSDSESSVEAGNYSTDNTPEKPPARRGRFEDSRPGGSGRDNA